MDDKRGGYGMGCFSRDDARIIETSEGREERDDPDDKQKKTKLPFSFAFHSARVK